MIDMPEHREILKANEDILYGNGGREDKVTAETVLKQMQQPRSLIVGLVYSGNGVLGLGGGNVFGAYQQAYLQHYLAYILLFRLSSVFLIYLYFLILLI